MPERSSQVYENEPNPLHAGWLGRLKARLFPVAEYDYKKIFPLAEYWGPGAPDRPIPDARTLGRGIIISAHQHDLREKGDVVPEAT